MKKKKKDDDNIIFWLFLGLIIFSILDTGNGGNGFSIFGDSSSTSNGIDGISATTTTITIEDYVGGSAEYPDVPTDDCNLVCDFYGYTGIDDLIGLPDYPHCMPAYQFITDSYGEMCCCKITYDCSDCEEICNIYEYGFGGYGPVEDIDECGEDPLSIISFLDYDCDVLCCCYLEDIEADQCIQECIEEDYVVGRSSTWEEGGCGSGEAVLVTGEDYHLCCCETGITDCNTDCISLGYDHSVLRGYCLVTEFMLGRLSSDSYCCCVS